MKILQLTRQFLPSEGGIESVVEGLGCALQRKGHTVCVATLRTLFATGETVSTESVEAGLTVKRMRHWGPRRYPIALAALAIAGLWTAFVIVACIGGPLTAALYLRTYRPNWIFR